VERLQTKPVLPLSHIERMGEVYGFASTGNVELRFRFFQLALSDHKSDVAKHYVPTAVNWTVGADGSNVIKGALCLRINVTECLI
jgi:leukotriene-A4 hydrolase